MGRVRFFWGVVAALLLGAGVAGAAVDRRGAYEVFRGGIRIGSERYTWDAGEDGRAVLQGECVLDLDGVSTTFRPVLTLQSPDLLPVGLTVEQSDGGEIRELSVQFTGARAERVIREKGMEARKGFKINPADLVIKDDILELFLPLAERYDFEAGGEQDFTVFDVEDGRAYAAHCRLRGMGTFENSSGKYRLRRLTIDLEDVAVDLYVDRAGRVPLIAIPLKKIEARLHGYDGGEQAAL